MVSTPSIIYNLKQTFALHSRFDLDFYGYSLVIIILLKSIINEPKNNF
ncbi:hypothetical protein SRABI27_05005 [Pedobacter sp. Bi27]|nr:hypothetical protein SRABI36_05195 [Pedobacter sp. Bi36]CAH0316025.1 hypothetical protein SRABI27_05005 [Pedobacter sp. Bi27]CAH0317693.1 hypothetical protein SRABI126_05085 [Pedobacter sp. Bi126]